MNLIARISLLTSLVWICQLSSIARAADCIQISTSEYLISEATSPEALSGAKFIPVSIRPTFAPRELQFGSKPGLKDCSGKIMCKPKTFESRIWSFGNSIRIIPTNSSKNLVRTRIRSDTAPTVTLQTSTSKPSTASIPFTFA